jgi:hypothetical protein
VGECFSDEFGEVFLGLDEFVHEKECVNIVKSLTEAFEYD